ncbi:MAG: hypothetical protein KGQ40_14255, partial [Rhodospirillales bacterium]|nr:hypothetical protein [Rhodospirillales bacterium]
MAGARRALLWFWAPVLVALAVGAGVLQWLGPLPAAHGPAAPAAPTPAAAPPAASPAAPAAPVAATPAALSPASPPVASAPVPTAPVPVSGVIAAPDPALLEPSPAYPGAMLPRIAADGRMAMHVYAATPPAAAGRPVVAVLLAGIGLSAADSLAAIHALPGAVSLAVSPYAAVPAPAPLAAAPAPPASLAEVLAAARAAGHELFVSIPMEPQNYPLN